MYGTHIRTEYATIPADIINPDSDRRYKYNWQFKPVIKAGTRFCVETYDALPELRAMAKYSEGVKLKLQEAEENGATYQRVSVYPVSHKHHGFVVYLTFPGGSETAEMRTDSDLGKLIWEALDFDDKSPAERVREAIGGYERTAFDVLAMLVDDGAVTVDAIADAYKRLCAEEDE